MDLLPSASASQYSPVVLNTNYGCLLKNPKNPLFLDMLILVGAHDLHPILDDLHEKVSDVVQDFQIVLNYGNFRKYYRSVIQIKLQNAADVEAFTAPRPFEEGDAFEVILNPTPTTL